MLLGYASGLSLHSRFMTHVKGQGFQLTSNKLLRSCGNLSHRNSLKGPKLAGFKAFWIRDLWFKASLRSTQSLLALGSS